MCVGSFKNEREQVCVCAVGVGACGCARKGEKERD